IEDLTVSGLHGGVALAGAAFKRVALEHCYAAVCVADNAVLLQLGSSRADPFPTHPQHVRDERVRHNELTRSEAVEAGEQPAAKLLLDGMMTVTQRRLRDLVHQGFSKAEQVLLEFAVRGQFALQRISVEAKSAQSALRYHAPPRDHAAGKCFHTDDPFVTDDRDLYARAAFRNFEQRSNARADKVQPIFRRTRLVNARTERQLDGLELRAQALEDRRGKLCENPIHCRPRMVMSCFPVARW